MESIGSIQFYDATIEEVVAVSAQTLELVPAETPQLLLSGCLWTSATIDLTPAVIAEMRQLLAEAEAQHRHQFSTKHGHQPPGHSSLSIP